MAEAPNILAQGTVDETDEIIYTVPGSTSAIVTVWFANDNISGATGIYLRANGTATQNILIPGVNLGAGEMMSFGPIALGTGDTLRAETVTGDDTVAYTVEGIEFT